jgi:hypothetical protein
MNNLHIILGMIQTKNQKKLNSVACSPQANYTDRATQDQSEPRQEAPLLNGHLFLFSFLVCGEIESTWYIGH